MLKNRRVMDVCGMQRLMTYLLWTNVNAGRIWGSLILPCPPSTCSVPQPSLSLYLGLGDCTCLLSGPVPGFPLDRSFSIHTACGGSCYSNTWKQASTLENIPAPPALITAWPLNPQLTRQWSIWNDLLLKDLPLPEQGQGAKLGARGWRKCCWPP